LFRSNSVTLCNIINDLDQRICRSRTKQKGQRSQALAEMLPGQQYGASFRVCPPMYRQTS
jgi:hypothetical protein